MNEEESELVVLDASGDRKLRWSRRKRAKDEPPDSELVPEAEKKARKEFNERVTKGYHAYRLKGEGNILTQGGRVYDYDPDVKMLMVLPEPQGGK